MSDAIRDIGEVTVAANDVVVRLPFQTGRTIAKILHRQDGADGLPIWLVLDRLVHDPRRHAEIGAWQASGAICTELRRA
jgi:hypothetical protein